MIHVLTVVAVISTLYAFGLNLSYVLLWPFARIGIAARVRQRDWAWYEEAFASPLTPGVSIVVPAYNEQAVVLESIQSLLSQRYPQFEVVLVDDGSDDRTAATVIEAHDLRQVEPTSRGRLTFEPVVEQWRSLSLPELTLIRKYNGGRADALNCGIDAARYPLICVTDADSIVDPSALEVMVRPFLEDPERVVAVGGTVRVGNSGRVEDGQMIEPRVPRRLVAGFQMIEYLRAFLLGRTGWDRLGALMIISGAFGLFRRDVLEQVGGYWTGTVGEDLEMTLRLHRAMRDQKRATGSCTRPIQCAGQRCPPMSAAWATSGGAGIEACGKPCGGTAACCFADATALSGRWVFPTWSCSSSSARCSWSRPGSRFRSGLRSASSTPGSCSCG